MNIDPSILIGASVPLAGFAFWLGRLEGRLTEQRHANEKLEKAMTQTKEETKAEVDKVNERVDKVENAQHKQGETLARVEANQDTMKDQISSIFTKLDNLPNRIKELLTTV